MVGCEMSLMDLKKAQEVALEKAREVALLKAREKDASDPLKKFRSKFHFPKKPDGSDYLYFTGNSLGLQPITARTAILQELDDWAKLGVEGHFEAKNPWLPYHEFVTESLCRVVGAKPTEVVAMNSLTVNLHLLMVSFYQPTKTRFKIVIEKGAFPSDQYAVASQIQFHAKTVGFDPQKALIEVHPDQELDEVLHTQGEEIALLLIGNVNYLTGFACDMKAITEKAHQKGVFVGFDLAHGAGNLELKLHDSGCDFAAWCSYKYLNSGPGGIAGVFIHERHATKDLPKFCGWWGHDKSTRFQMGPHFKPIVGAESWQLSNPPIFQLAALKASLEIFDEAGMSNLRKKSVFLTGFLADLLQEHLGSGIEIITPLDPNKRGSQLSLKFKKFKAGKDFQHQLRTLGVICDFREPDIIRMAPTALYNSFEDCVRLVEILKKVMSS